MVLVRGTIRRVGNSVALLIPVAEAKRANLQPGQRVAAEISPETPSAFGMLSHLPYKPFIRAKEGFYRDRI